MRKELQPVLEQAKSLSLAELPFLIGDLEAVKSIALGRLITPMIEGRPDEMLDVEQAAHRLHVSKDFLYRNHRHFPFTRHIGRKLLFSSAGLDSYLKKPR